MISFFLYLFDSFFPFFAVIVDYQTREELVVNFVRNLMPSEVQVLYVGNPSYLKSS